MHTRKCALIKGDIDRYSLADVWAEFGTGGLELEREFERYV